jgi:hypothetical protein
VSSKRLGLALGTVTIDVDVDVEGWYQPPDPGRVERGTGIPLEPSYPAGIEVTKVSLRCGDKTLDITGFLSPDTLDEINALANTQLQESGDDT